MKTARELLRGALVLGVVALATAWAFPAGSQTTLLNVRYAKLHI